MIAAYILVVLTVAAAMLTGYVVAALFPGRLVEGFTVAFALGIAWWSEAYPWLERRIGKETP